MTYSEIQQEQILTEAKARKMCLEILGQIESTIYNAGDVSLLVETSSRLEEIHKYLQENSIMAGGLPAKKKLKWRTSLIRKIKKKYAPSASKKRNKTKLESKPVPQQQPDASLQSPPVHMQEDDLNEKGTLSNSAFFCSLNYILLTNPVFDMLSGKISRETTADKHCWFNTHVNM